MVPLRESARPFPDTEDKAFSIWLGAQFDEILSLSETPVPSCPHCGGDQTMLAARPNPPHSHLPTFRCLVCRVNFRRTKGTPLSGLKFRNLNQFIRLLSQQRPISDAARALEVEEMTVTRWVKRVREWILQLDPSGHWETRVRLGMEILPDLVCPRCGANGTMHYRGFKRTTDERNCSCHACGYFRELSHALAAQGDGFRLEHRIRIRPPSPRRKT
jgi:transposase-like protein